jgi:hypothetical protein
VEAVGFLGGAFTLAGVATFMAHWRRDRTFITWPAGLAILGLVMLASAAVVLTLPKAVAPAAPAPGPTAPASAPASAPAVAVPAWTTYEQFYALTPAQQTEVMQQAVDHVDAVLKQALGTLDASHLNEVYSGTELGLVTKQVEDLRLGGHPLGGKAVATVRQVVPAKPPVPLVTVRVVGTDTSWYVDPKTGQPDSATRSVQVDSLMEIVWGGGQWRIQHVENASPSPAS